MPDPIRVQVEVSVDVPRGAELTADLMHAVLSRWMSSGDLPSGFKILAIEWGKGSYDMRGSANTPLGIRRARRLLQWVPFQFSEIRNR